MNGFLLLNAFGCGEWLFNFVVEFHFQIYCRQKPSDWHSNIKHPYCLGPSGNPAGIRTNNINAQLTVKSD